MRRIFPFIWILVLPLSLISCGYRFLGPGTSLPGHINNIAIPVFINNSGEPQIEVAATEAVRREFIEDGRLQVVTGGVADALLQGEITSYRVEALSFDQNDNVTENRLMVNINFTLTDQVQKKTIVTLRLPARWEYSVSADLPQAELARKDAENRAFEEMAQKLPGLLIEGF